MAVILKKRVLAEYGALNQTIEPPWKRFKISLLKKNVDVTDTTYFDLLKSCKSSKEAFQLLIRLPELLTIKGEDLQKTLKQLSDNFNQYDSTVRSKIFSLFHALGHNPDINNECLIDHAMKLITLETSHKVISEGLSTILTLLKTLKKKTAIANKVYDISKHFLKDTNHYVKIVCLRLIYFINGVENTKLISSYLYSDDARVRSTALEILGKLYEEGNHLDISLYLDVSNVLNDDYEIVRVAALKIICLIGNTYPETNINLHDENIKLIDDAFIKICQAVTDSSVSVRNTAMHLIGTLVSVSSRFLNQTLDKKLMSNMRKKNTFHERTSKLVTSGEWSSGKKWACDAPQGLLHIDEVSILSSGACGAFVHGLEDEFMEIRCTSVNSLCSLALAHPDFAALSLDFLVDMLSDEIECVRLKAITAITSMAHLIIIREHQLETILSGLEDSSVNIREGIHEMLTLCNFSSKKCLQICIECLIDNLKKYPLDKMSTWNAAKEIGRKHSELILPIIPRLLGIHPFLDSAEPNVEDPLYVTLLIFVFNAAINCPTIVSLFEEHTVKHYDYLSMSLPSFIPQLVLAEPGNAFEPVETNSSSCFLWRLVDTISIASPKEIPIILEQLKAFAKMDSCIAGTTKFTALFVSCQVLLSEILQKKVWLHNSLTEMQFTKIKSDLSTLLSMCFKLQHLFLGIEKDVFAIVKHIQLISIALQFVFLVKTRKILPVSLLKNLLNETKCIEQYFFDNKYDPGKVSLDIINVIKDVENNIPTEFIAKLLPLLEKTTLMKLPHPNNNIRICHAQLSGPTTSVDTPLKFTAGLIMAVQLDALIFSLQDPKTLRIRVQYPNDSSRIYIPREADLQPINSEGDYRLSTKALLFSHNSWSEACYVEISLGVEISDGNSSSCINLGLETYADLCIPLKLYVRSKPSY